MQKGIECERRNDRGKERGRDGWVMKDEMMMMMMMKVGIEQ